MVNKSSHRNYLDKNAMSLSAINRRKRSREEAGSRKNLSLQAFSDLKSDQNSAQDSTMKKVDVNFASDSAEQLIEVVDQKQFRHIQQRHNYLNRKSNKMETSKMRDCKQEQISPFSDAENCEVSSDGNSEGRIISKKDLG